MSEWTEREPEKWNEQNSINNQKESKPIIEVTSGASESTSFSPMTMVTNLMRSSSAEVSEKINTYNYTYTYTFNN